MWHCDIELSVTGVRSLGSAFLLRLQSCFMVSAHPESQDPASVVPCGTDRTKWTLFILSSSLQHGWCNEWLYSYWPSHAPLHHPPVFDRSDSECQHTETIWNEDHKKSFHSFHPSSLPNPIFLEYLNQYLKIIRLNFKSLSATSLNLNLVPRTDRGRIPGGLKLLLSADRQYRQVCAALPLLCVLGHTGPQSEMIC